MKHDCFSQRLAEKRTDSRADFNRLTMAVASVSVCRQLSTPTEEERRSFCHRLSHHATGSMGSAWAEKEWSERVNAGEAQRAAKKERLKAAAAAAAAAASAAAQAKEAADRELTAFATGGS